MTNCMEITYMIGAVIPNVNLNVLLGYVLCAPELVLVIFVEDNFALDNSRQDSLYSFELQRYFNLASGGVYEINQNILFKPSFLIKFSPLSPINYDLNASLLLKKYYG